MLTCQRRSSAHFSSNSWPASKPTKSSDPAPPVAIGKHQPCSLRLTHTPSRKTLGSSKFIQIHGISFDDYYLLDDYSRDVHPGKLVEASRSWLSLTERTRELSIFFKYSKTFSSGNPRFPPNESHRAL